MQRYYAETNADPALPDAADADPAPSPTVWQRRRAALAQRVRAARPFLAGVAAALLALLVYQGLFPTPAPLTATQVNEAVAHALASATPAPPYSAQVYQLVRPALVLI